MTKKNLSRAGMAAAQMGAAALLTLGAAGPVQAQQDVAADWEHFVDCFGWMITDPPTQVQNCMPNNVVVEFRSLSTPVEGSDEDYCYPYCPT